MGERLLQFKHQRPAARAVAQVPREDGGAQVAFEVLEINGYATVIRDVHHGQDMQRRHLELRQQQRQVEVALEVGAIYDVNEEIRAAADDEVYRHALVLAGGHEGVDAGQINDGEARTVGQQAESLLALDCHARPVANGLACPRQGIEDGRLAGVRISNKGDREAALHTAL